jgi:pyruvate, water dikinase
LRPENLLVASSGPIVGQSLSTHIDRVIYVLPSVYGQMSMSHRYSVARTIGQLTHLESPAGRPVILLIGPGRWGTSMPSLGVPVSFAEINTVTVLCEVASMHEGLVPDVSLGTHFFNDLVEMDMLYLAITPDKEGCQLNEKRLLEAPNRLAELLPQAAQWAGAIRVIEAGDNEHGIFLNADTLKQKAVCYWDRREDHETV